ncbi:MAG: ABC transporter permease, partial [Pseudohongiellaceae bacterium]
MRPLYLTVARTLTQIFMRDRQAIFFSLFFPIIFMSVFGFVDSRQPEPFNIGLVNEAPGELSANFRETLDQNPLFLVEEGTEEALRESLIAGDTTLVIVIPPEFQQTDSNVQLRVLVDAAQVQMLGLIMPVLDQTLLSIERQL